MSRNILDLNRLVDSIDEDQGEATGEDYEIGGDSKLQDVLPLSTFSSCTRTQELDKNLKKPVKSHLAFFLLCKMSLLPLNYSLLFCCVVVMFYQAVQE